MGKIILDKNIKQKEGFLLNLEGLEILENLSLDIQELILKIKETILNKDYTLGSSYVKLLDKLSDYGNREADFAKVNYYYNEIVFNYKNLNKNSLEEVLKVFLLIRSFMSYYISLRHDDLDEVFSEKMEEVISFKNELNLEELLNKTYVEEKRIPTIVEYKLIKQYIKRIGTKGESIKLALNSNLKKEFNKIKGLDKVEAIKSIIATLDTSYEKDFYNSIEFLNITLNEKYINFESYDDLLEFINKEYLLYRFNESKSINEKNDILIEFYIDEYIDIPEISREIIVNRLVGRRRYNIVEEFFDILQEEIKELIKVEKINFLPIKL